MSEEDAMNILLVEDSPGDIRLTLEAFREENPSVVLYVTRDGIEAMAFLKREGINAKLPRPDLILLDLNMPRMDGRQVLAQIKTDESLRLIPTFILTTSDADDDVLRSYQLQANGYLRKPVALDEFEDLVKSINGHWIQMAALPSQAFGEQRG
jgi:chemotaxis family two-component system response regulator Rcp1